MTYSTTIVLVAEDDVESYKYLEILLERVGLKVLRATTGTDAIDIFRKNPELSLILMDIKMPVMDGITATKEIRKFNRTIPIIAQTAYAFKSDIEEFLNMGCNDYISKPIQQNDLMQIISKYIEIL